MTEPVQRDAVLRRLRRSQGGAVARAQALQAGFSKAEVATLLRRGTWVVAERGVYLEGAVLSAADVWAGHALRVAARNLALGGGHAASRRSAAVVLGLPVLGGVPAPPELVRGRRRAGDTSASSSIRVTLEPPDVVRWRDVACTSPARLVCDTARTHGQMEALMIADAALRARLPRSLLTSAATACRGWPGAAAVTEVLACADGRTDSPLESITRWVLRSLGVPPPLSQVDVLHDGEFLGRADFAWPALGVVLEADGMGKYVSGTLAAEKKRELGMRRAGLEVMRCTWDDAWRQPEVIQRDWKKHVALAAATADARVRVTFQLARLEPWGKDGIVFPSKAAQPLPAPLP
jgi:hypothetical protein